MLISQINVQLQYKYYFIFQFPNLSIPSDISVLFPKVNKYINVILLNLKNALH